MKSRVVFSHQSDEWETPQALFDELDAEFHFTLDCAATEANRKCENWLGPGSPINTDALAHTPWGIFNWLNPPYSQVRAFVAKAAQEVEYGCTTVLLLPARTDTRWWHGCVWDRPNRQCYPWASIRFLKGRLKFGGATNGAPFPSVVVVMKP